MENEKILYTDGRNVTVTASQLQVKNQWYQLSEITKHNFAVLKPKMFSSIILLVIGLTLEVIGAANWMPSAWLPSIYVLNFLMTVSLITMGIGIIFLLSGAVRMVLSRERYAVCIATGGDVKMVVISKKKEYVAQIVRALNEALFARLADPLKEQKRTYTVSGR